MKSLDEIDIILRNNTPVDDYLNLSHAEMQHLVLDAYGDKSPVQIRDDIGDTTLDQIPLFRIAEEFLKIIDRDKQIKLTPLGALPKKVMVELYEKKFLLDEILENGIRKLWREDDSISIRSARIATEYAGLVRKANGKLTLTKKAKKLLDTKKRVQIFEQFIKAFTDEFLWSFNDGYPELPIGQLGWAFSLMMLDKFGDQPQTVDFYAGKYLSAFPAFISFFHPGYSTPEQQFSRCYGLRTFERFFLWFGLMTVDKQKKFLDIETDKFMRTDLVKIIFKIDTQCCP